MDPLLDSLRGEVAAHTRLIPFPRSRAVRSLLAVESVARGQLGGNAPPPGFATCSLGRGTRRSSHSGPGRRGPPVRTWDTSPAAVAAHLTPPWSAPRPRRSSVTEPLSCLFTCLGLPTHRQMFSGVVSTRCSLMKISRTYCDFSAVTVLCPSVREVAQSDCQLLLSVPPAAWLSKSVGRRYLR